ncbi:MAG: NAD(P)H-hydrate epimerase [Planctomycetes bacterium]|nr:NAD(P)H-hydrate epimerase [Planctomycetota bacterium]
MAGTLRDIAVTRETMRELDRIAIEEYGIPGLILMENAGIGCTRAAIELMTRTEKSRAVIFAGPGNNGGDGFVVARHLMNSGYETLVCHLAGSSGGTADLDTNRRIYENMDGLISIIEEGVSASAFIYDHVPDDVIIVDALFGTGLTKPLEGTALEIVRELSRTKTPKLAVDVPSGLCANTGKVLGACAQMEMTICLGLPKKGLFEEEGADLSGEVHWVDISLPRDLVDRALNNEALSKKGQSDEDS